MRTILDYLTRNHSLFILIATWVAVIVALFTLMSTQKSSRLSLGIEVLLRLDERFQSKHVRCARSRAAAVLSKLANNQITTDDEQLKDTDEVLDFFESLGSMIRGGVLNAKFLYNYFFDPIEGYWLAAEKYIASVRQDSPATWEDFKYLYRRTRAIEKKKIGKYVKLSRDELATFLSEELQVCAQE